MKTEKEILNKIKEYKNKIEILQKKIQEDSDSSKLNKALEVNIMCFQQGVIDLEWVLNKSDYLDKLLSKPLDK